MSKTTWGAEFNEDTDAYLRKYRDARGINNSEALRRLVRKGIRAEREKTQTPLQQSLLTVSLVMILAAGVAGTMAAGTGWPEPLFLTAGACGIAGLLAAIGYGAVSGRTPLSGRLGGRKRAATDGGERE